MVKMMNYEFKIMNWMKLAWVVLAIVAAAYTIHSSRLLLAQQPQAPAGTPLYSVNAKYVNGMAPGYWPTAGSGLTLNLSAGTAYCGNPPTLVSYPGGSLTLTASATNYVYLDPANNCAPAASTSAFTAGQIPVATVVAGASSITSVTDARTLFTPQPCVTGTAGSLNCSAMGTNQNITLTPSGTGASVITNLQDKGGQVFNVKAYGAVGNGTTDDSIAINSAISAAASVKGTVFFPPGTYLTNSLNVIPSNIALEGAGSHNTTLKYTGTGVGFAFTGTNEDKIGSLTFDCSTGPASACVELADTSSAAVARNNFWDNVIIGGTYCLELNSTTSAGILWNTFRNLNLQQCDTHALYMTLSGSGFNNENLFQGGVWRTTTNTQTTVQVTGGDNFFEDIDVEGNSGTGGVGFAFVSAALNTIIGGDLENNTECMTFDANSFANKIINVSGVGPYQDNSTTFPSGNDVISGNSNTFTQIRFATPSYGHPTAGIDFYDTGGMGNIYEYFDGSQIRLGTDTTTNNDYFRFNMTNGVFEMDKGGFQPTQKTVGTLPTPANATGQMYQVTDSTAISTEGQTCVGGAAERALAWSDGSVWKCF